MKRTLPPFPVLVVASLFLASTPVAAPAFAPWSGPIAITSGGTYAGSWESTDSTPAIRIATTEPVTITGRVRNVAGGTLIDAVGAGPADVTVDHMFAYGGDRYDTSGRFFQAYDFKSITIRNSTIENTRGIQLTYGVAGSSVLITGNKQHNIQGKGTSPVGNFVQLRHVRNATINVSWNEIVNEYNESYPEDVISLYHTSNARVHDNMLWHQSTPGNPYNQSSQGGITIDCSDAGPSCDSNVIARNQVIDGFGIVTYVTQGGSNNRLLENRVVSDGRLPLGQRIGSGWLAIRILPGGANNHAHGNVIGYVNYTGRRLDGHLDGASEGHLAEWRNNTRMAGPIRREAEQEEWLRWRKKLSTRRISIGA